MTRQKNCAARQGADQQMHCARCGFTWDIDDPEPPACLDKPAPRPKVTKPRKRKSK